MLVGDAIKEMIHRAGTTQSALAKAAGYNTISSVSTPIAKNNLNVSTLVKLAGICGYDVMLVRRNAVEPEYPIKLESAEVS